MVRRNATASTADSSRTRMAETGTPRICRFVKFGKSRRRLDLQPAAIADVDRLDDEAGRQGRDDRAECAAPGSSDSWRRRSPGRSPAPPAARPQPGHRCRSSPSSIPRWQGRYWPAATDRHCPGPSVMTNIWPSPDHDREYGQRKRRGDHAARADAAGEGDGQACQTTQRAEERPDPGLGDKTLIAVMRSPPCGRSARAPQGR